VVAADGGHVFGVSAAGAAPQLLGLFPQLTQIRSARQLDGVALMLAVLVVGLLVPGVGMVGAVVSVVIRGHRRPSYGSARVR
jgi:hypothetical protein